MKNCYTWARDQIASHGGEWFLAWSDNWFGHFHVVYVDKGGTMWGYDPDVKRYISLWSFIMDGGLTFKGHTTEYTEYVKFIDGLKAKIISFTRGG